MALEQCIKDGRPGYRWGNGACHTGSDGKARAEREGATDVMGGMDDIGVAREGEPKTKARVSAAKTTAPETVEAAPEKTPRKRAAKKS